MMIESTTHKRTICSTWQPSLAWKMATWSATPSGTIGKTQGTSTIGLPQRWVLSLTALIVKTIRSGKTSSTSSLLPSSFITTCTSSKKFCTELWKSILERCARLSKSGMFSAVFLTIMVQFLSREKWSSSNVCKKTFKTSSRCSKSESFRLVSKFSAESKLNLNLSSANKPSRFQKWLLALI